MHAAGALGRLTPVAHILPNDWAEVVGGQPGRRLAADPHLRSAAARGRGRPRGVRDRRARAREPKAYWGAYGATKAGMEHLVLTWADEVATTRLRVNLFDPGPMSRHGCGRRRSRARTGARLPRPEAVAPALAALCLPAQENSGSLIRFWLVPDSRGFASCRSTVLLGCRGHFPGIGERRSMDTQY